MIYGHHEHCNVFQMSPDGGPSQKPCNCAKRIDVVQELQHLISVNGYFPVSRCLLKQTINEILRLRNGLQKIVSMSGGPFSEQVIRAREILIGDKT